MSYAVYVQPDKKKGRWPTPEIVGSYTTSEEAANAAQGILNTGAFTTVIISVLSDGKSSPTSP